MTLQNSSGNLSAAVPPGGSFDAPYPAGTSHGNFSGGRDHAVAIGQNVYSAPNQISVHFAEAVTVTNLTPSEWPVGTPYALSLDMPGSDVSVSNDSGQTLPRVQPWPVVYLNLGSPVAEDEEGLRVAAPITEAGPVALLVTRFDLPRNITFHSTSDESELIFTVTSTDEYGVRMYEEIDGASHGRKAHHTNIAVHASGASTGPVQIGWGPEIGLPCFVPSGAVIIKELVDGEVAETEGVVLFGDDGPASATSGDVRGTYESELSPDGVRTFGLLCCLPDPGYQGADQFAG